MVSVGRIMRVKGINKKILAGILAALCAVQVFSSCFISGSLEAKPIKSKNNVNLKSSANQQSGAKSNGSNNDAEFKSSAKVKLKKAKPRKPDKFVAGLRKQGFPESYIKRLVKLHKKYPKWVFKADKRGDFATAVSSQRNCSLIYWNSPSSWKSMEKGCYDWKRHRYIGKDGGAWVAASEGITKFYMDPRNFMNTADVFQFLSHRYESYQSIEGIEAVVKNSFLDGKPYKKSKRYSAYLLKAGKRSGVNPYVLSSMILVEQGFSGYGGCISGKHKGFKNIYNHFNIGAYAHSNRGPVVNGLIFAKAKMKKASYGRPWNNKIKSILGGALYYGVNYVRGGQDTFYLKKFNVVKGKATHQYMTNVQGAFTETRRFERGYKRGKNAKLTFRIPVYKNMPKNACSKPKARGNNDNFIKSAKISGGKLTKKWDRYRFNYVAKLKPGKKFLEIELKLSGAKAYVKNKRIVLVKGKAVTVTVISSSGVKRNYKIKCI